MSQRPLIAVGFVAGLLACEATSVPLDPPSDAGASSDAARPRDDAGPDAGAPDVAGDSGPRLFTARVGRVYGPDPESFVPADLSGYTLTARSAIGTSTPTIDGPGRFSVWAQGRLELALVSSEPYSTSYMVSTEADRVDLSFSGRPPPDAPRVARLRLRLQLSSPWTASDTLRVITSGAWSAFRETDAIAIGETVAAVTVEGSESGRIVGEDLWVVRYRSERTTTGTVTRRVDEVVVRDVRRAELEEPISLRLSPPPGQLPSVSWDVSAWRPDGVSTPWIASAARVIVRADRIAPGLGVGDAGDSSVLDRRVSADGLSGTLPEGSPGPSGYVVCTSATRHSDGPWLREIAGVRILTSTIRDCTSGGAPARLTLGPIRDLRLDGEPFGPATRNYRAPFTLSWRAPDAGVANGYVVVLSHTSSALLVATDQTQVSIPAGLIPAGATVFPTVAAIDDPDLPPVESPMVRSRRFQQSEWAGGLLVPEP